MDERFDRAFERWVQQNRDFGRIVVVDRGALHALSSNGVRGPLRWFQAGLWAELALSICTVAWLGNAAADWVHEPVAFGSAVVLDVFAILLLINLGMQIATLRSIDYAGPVALVQSKLERLRLQRLRAARGIFAFALLAWVPLAIVGLRAVLGIDVSASLDRTWLWVNVAAGMAFVPVAIWICRVLETRAGSNVAWQYVLRTISGSNLTAAFAALRAVDDFRNESA
jgi:hypothetical protein